MSKLRFERASQLFPTGERRRLKLFATVAATGALALGSVLAGRRIARRMHGADIFQPDELPASGLEAETADTPAPPEATLPDTNSVADAAGPDQEWLPPTTSPTPGSEALPPES